MHGTNFWSHRRNKIFTGVSPRPITTSTTSAASLPMAQHSRSNLVTRGRCYVPTGTRARILGTQSIAHKSSNLVGFKSWQVYWEKWFVLCVRMVWTSRVADQFMCAGMISQRPGRWGPGPYCSRPYGWRAAGHAHPCCQHLSPAVTVLDLATAFGPGGRKGFSDLRRRAAVAAARLDP